MTPRTLLIAMIFLLIGIFSGAFMLKLEVKNNPEWRIHDTIPVYSVVCDSAHIPKFINKLP